MSRWARSRPFPPPARCSPARARAGACACPCSAAREHNFFTDGGRELFDCAAQGRIDAFFLGGAQIDGAANINLVGIGGYPRSDVRLAGSFGSSYLYFLVPRVILFKPEHTRRTLVERVDFVSAPGTSPPGTYRPGGPVALADRALRVRLRPRRGALPRWPRVHPDQTPGRRSRATPASTSTSPERRADHARARRGDPRADPRRGRAASSPAPTPDSPHRCSRSSSGSFGARRGGEKMRASELA